MGYLMDSGFDFLSLGKRVFNDNLSVYKVIIWTMSNLLSIRKTARLMAAAEKVKLTITPGSYAFLKKCNLPLRRVENSPLN